MPLVTSHRADSANSHVRQVETKEKKKKKKGLFALLLLTNIDASEGSLPLVTSQRPDLQNCGFPKQFEDFLFPFQGVLTGFHFLNSHLEPKVSMFGP